MAYSPYIRYLTNHLDLSGIVAPVFPNRRGLSLYNNVTAKPEYSINNRNHGMTRIGWGSQSIKQTARNTIWSYWSSTLDYGYTDVTLIDNRSRMLFEASWNEWNEQWTKTRGGVYDIDYPITSSVPWTPPMFGLWPSTTSNLVNHNLSGDDLTTDDGSMVEVGVDSNVLRNTGYALRCTGTAGTDRGANGAVSWKSGNSKNSISLFCQCRLPILVNNSIGGFEILGINDGANHFRIGADDYSGNYNAITALITTGGNTSTLRKTDNTVADYPIDTWFDLCATYDSVNGDVFFYSSPSALTSYTNYLENNTDYNGTYNTDRLLSNNYSTPVYPANTTWTDINMLYERGSYITNTDNAYIQNSMVIDDFITPHGFNTLRRLCYLWNNKTGTFPA